MPKRVDVHPGQGRPPRPRRTGRPRYRPRQPAPQSIPFASIVRCLVALVARRRSTAHRPGLLATGPARKMVLRCARLPSKLWGVGVGDVAFPPAHGRLGPWLGIRLPQIPWILEASRESPSPIPERTHTGRGTPHAGYRAHDLPQLRRSQRGSGPLEGVFCDSLCVRGHAPGRTDRSASTRRSTDIFGSARAQRSGAGKRRDSDPHRQAAVDRAPRRPRDTGLWRCRRRTLRSSSARPGSRTPALSPESSFFSPSEGGA
jgi:hypothetical protein